MNFNCFRKKFHPIVLGQPRNFYTVVLVFFFLLEVMMADVIFPHQSKSTQGLFINRYLCKLNKFVSIFKFPAYLFVKETIFKVFKNQKILAVRSLYFVFFKSNPFFQVFSKSIKLSNCQTLKQEKKYHWNLNDSPSEYVVQQSESKKFRKLLFNSDLQRGYLFQYVCTYIVQQNDFQRLSTIQPIFTLKFNKDLSS